MNTLDRRAFSLFFLTFYHSFQLINSKIQLFFHALYINDFCMFFLLKPSFREVQAVYGLK